MVKKRKIVFLAVNASYSHTSLALRYLDGCVDRAVWETCLYEITVGDDPDKAAVDIERLAPDLLAATFYLFNRDFLIRCLRRYKTLDPRCVIVCGGPEFLGDNRRFFESAGFVDLVVRGEGEKAFASFLGGFDSSSGRQSVPGACGLKNGRYFDNGFAEPVENLDDLPFPYLRFPPGGARPFVHLETSRGCSNGCIFCVSANTGPVRFISAKRVKEHLDMIAAMGTGSVRIIDRTFNEKPARAAAMIRMFRDLFPEIRFHLEIDPARLTPAVINETAKARAGQLHIEAGVQTLNPSALAALNRKCTPNATIRGVQKLCSMKNVETHVDLIAGLPHASFADMVSDLKMLVELKPAEIQLETLKILPGTPVSLQLPAFELKAMPDPPYAVLETNRMSAREIGAAQRLSVLVDKFYNTDCFKDIITEAVKQIPDFWTRFPALFKTRKCLGAIKTLEERFACLHEFFGEQEHKLRWKLQYAWMKRGLSARKGICRAVRFSGPVPVNARLLEGDPAVSPARIYILDADRKYMFIYGKGQVRRYASAVYEMP